MSRETFEDAASVDARVAGSNEASEVFSGWPSVLRVSIALLWSSDSRRISLERSDARDSTLARPTSGESPGLPVREGISDEIRLLGREESPPLATAFASRSCKRPFAEIRDADRSTTGHQHPTRRFTFVEDTFLSNRDRGFVPFGVFF